MATDSHIAEMAAIGECQETRPISDFGTVRLVQASRSVKTLEIQLAVLVAANTSIRTVDQFTASLKRWGKDHSILKNVKVKILFKDYLLYVLISCLPF